MPGITLKETLKLRIKHDDGSKTFSNCNNKAEDDQIHLAANTIVGLTYNEGIEISKIVETPLLGR